MALCAQPQNRSRRSPCPPARDQRLRPRGPANRKRNGHSPAPRRRERQVLPSRLAQRPHADQEYPALGYLLHDSVLAAVYGNQRYCFLRHHRAGAEHWVVARDKQSGRGMHSDCILAGNFPTNLPAGSVGSPPDPAGRVDRAVGGNGAIYGGHRGEHDCDGEYGPCDAVLVRDLVRHELEFDSMALCAGDHADAVETCRVCGCHVLRVAVDFCKMLSSHTSFAA